MLYKVVVPFSRLHNYLETRASYTGAHAFDRLVNTYIVRSYRDVIVVTNIVTRRSSKAYSIIMY